MTETIPSTPILDPGPVRSARAVGLRHVSDASPGIRRVPAGKGFRYVGPRGEPIRDAATLARIRSLVIPPAWMDVWICPVPEGHIQATGRDARGRKQYRYHRRWHAVRDETKYGRLIAFGQALPRIRRAIDRDLARPGLPRRKVLAAVVRLLEKTLIRVGNPEYARTNGSYGLTTLRDEHAQISGSRIRFRFRGKTGKFYDVDLHDRRVANIVRRCRELPGFRLFGYLDPDHRRLSIESADVNEYLREASGQEFTAKDFRTWAGTVLAAVALEELDALDGGERRRNVIRAVETVARRLGNTPAICRKCYVHPAVIETYLEGGIARWMKRRTERALVSSLDRLRPEEALVLALLRERLGREARRQA